MSGMRHALANESWKSLLPDSSLWLNKLQLAAAAQLPQTAHAVVGVQAKDDDKANYSINARDLDKSTQDQLSSQAKALGWLPAAGPLHLQLGGRNYSLVPLPTSKVNVVQLARQFGLDAARATKELRLAHLAVFVPESYSGADVFDGLASGFYGHLGFKGTRKRDLEKLPGAVTIIDSALVPQALKSAHAHARAAALVRFLQDAPPNYLDPVKFAEIANELAKDAGFNCQILDKAAMTALGMGSFLSVSDGSVTEPRLITIEIPGIDNSRSIALVGKGLTFDAGGVSIKAAVGMEEMKYDMSGGAAVLGAVEYFRHHQPPCKVICAIGATENLISGGATRPGDIVRAFNGKTIEIHNTDAEGRLVLADVLAYVIKEHKPELVVDIATLTGAVLMALGSVGAALFSNDQAAADFVLGCGKAAGEPLWQLPLWGEFEKETRGDVADLKNIAKASVKAGSIMGAMFIKEFVGDTKWVHLDIAGTGWNCQAVGFPSAGGSSFGLRTLTTIAMRYQR